MRPNMWFKTALSAAGAVAFLAWLAPAAAQQTATISGTVTEAASGRSLAGAQVTLSGVGAAGLGQRISEQTSSFDYQGILASIMVLVVLTVAADIASAAIRRTLR